MPRKRRLSGVFYLAAGLVISTGGVFLLASQQEGGVEALFAPAPTIAAPDAARHLAAGLAGAADAYLADDYPYRNRVLLKRLCDELADATNGALAAAGADSRFDFDYDPRIGVADDAYGLCTISFNDHMIAWYNDYDLVDEENEIVKLRRLLLAALPESDIIKLRDAAPVGPAP